MSFEAIKSIAETETAAENIKSEAVKQAKSIISSADDAKRVLREKALKEAEDVNAKALAEAQLAGKADVAAMSNEDEAALADLRKTAEGKMEKAVNLIVERVVNG